MSTRGLKYNFIVGEFVLCFEPDSTKAKVLYDAKVLDLQRLKDKDGKKIPGYHIHFQGWNSSWDRIVSEEFILKGTEENRLLMKKLAETARKNQSKDNRKRKRGLDEEDRSDEDEEDGGDDEEEEDGGDDEEEEDGGDDEGSTKLDGDSEDDDDSEVSQSGCSESTESSDSVSVDLPLPKQPTHEPVEILIPDVLKLKLEDDYYFINHREKLVKLPVRPSVIEILEGFVKSYCLNLLCDPADRDRSRSNSSDSWHHAPGRWIPLCKEMVDGLRICFDFTLPEILLYSLEKEHYKHISNNITLDKLQNQDTVSCPSHSVAKRQKLHSPTQTLHQESDDDSSSVDLMPRRITRRSIAEDVPRSNPKGRKAGQRSKRVVSFPVEVKTEPNTDNEIIFNLNVQCSNQNIFNTHPCSSNGNIVHTPEAKEEVRYDMMDNLLSWQLLPPDVQTNQPIRPSQIYGVHHLLRLFVKLPSLLNKMNIDEARIQILMKLVDSCLQYLAEREDIFNEENYIDS